MESSNGNIAYISLGSNLGNRFNNIKEAIYRLGSDCAVLEISEIDETEPVGFRDQPSFFNCIVKVSTEMSPYDLLDFTQKIEIEMGREKNFKNGPRLIDLDILFFNDTVLDSPDLIIPHPRAAEREFVLKPMSEIAPKYTHPVLKKDMHELFGSL